MSDIKTYLTPSYTRKARRDWYARNREKIKESKGRLVVEFDKDVFEQINEYIKEHWDGRPEFVKAAIESHKKELWK